MAFFGLTALGPQNSFAASSTLFKYIQIFDESDFQNAWFKINGKDSSYCQLSKLPSILKVLYHGPIPVTDEALVLNAFDNYDYQTPNIIGYEVYLSILNKLRYNAELESKQLEGKNKSTCEYNSTTELALAMKKNAAMKKEIQTKLTVPLTGTQEVSDKSSVNSYYRLFYTLYIRFIVSYIYYIYIICWII